MRPSAFSGHGKTTVRFIVNVRVVALVAARVRATTTRFALLAGLAALALPGMAWAAGHCDSVTAGAVRDRSDIQAFVECAHAYAMQHGSSEAARAFREDERWRDGSIYVFVDRQAASGSVATSYVFPPDPAREGQPWGPLVDEFGSDYFVETNHIFDLLGASTGGGAVGPAASWMYYSLLDWYDDLCNCAEPSRTQDPILDLHGVGKELWRGKEADR